MTDHPSCAERVGDELNSTMEDIRTLIDFHSECGWDRYHPDLGRLADYGLALDWNGECVRWQLSWGGPSDELRYYVDCSSEPYRVEYVFLGWFDGASRDLHGDDLNTALEAWEALFMKACLPDRAV